MFEGELMRSILPGHLQQLLAIGEGVFDRGVLPDE